MDKELIKKAKRRIQRFVKTGEKVSRVRATDDPMIFKYIAKHHAVTLWFRRDRIGRLRQVDPTKIKMVA